MRITRQNLIDVIFLVAVVVIACAAIFTLCETVTRTAGATAPVVGEP